MTPRTRYRYSSRKAAEDAELKATHQNHLLQRGLQALYRRDIEWWYKSRSKRSCQRLVGELVPIPQYSDCPYWVGLFDKDSPAGPKILLVFHSITGNQAHSLTVHDAYEWCQTLIAQFTNVPPEPTNQEALDLRDLVYRVRQEL
jgi:hypothetical protein